MHTCPLVNPGPVPHVGGPVTVGFPTVLIGGIPAARLGDLTICAGPPDPIAIGSPCVLIGGAPAARVGDSTTHGGIIVSGMLNVLIGECGGGGGGGGAAPVAGLSAQANALLDAAVSGAPFCEQCASG